MRYRSKNLVIIKKLRWYHRVRHLILTFFGKECYACEVVDEENYCLKVMRVWLCPSCLRYVGYDRGCDHEDPEESKLCDDCWSERRDKIAQEKATQ